ncbi:MAG: hypothetical protein ABIT20_15015 [Gemmatimonadaceae bacterium]
MTPPRFFNAADRFGAWLERNHESAAELWVGFHKKDSGLPSLTRPESVDEALRFGWIDRVRKTADDTSYVIRFTPSKASSVWSNVNIAKVDALIAQDRPGSHGARWSLRYARRTHK